MAVGWPPRGFKERFHVETFIEYIDNLLFIVSSECDVDNFVLHLAKLGIYSTKLEETSDSGIDFLDMHIFKGPDFASTASSSAVILGIDASGSRRSVGRLHVRADLHLQALLQHTRVPERAATKPQLLCAAG